MITNFPPLLAFASVRCSHQIPVLDYYSTVFVIVAAPSAFLTFALKAEEQTEEKRGGGSAFKQL